MDTRITTIQGQALRNIAGQLSPRSVRIYQHDAKVFATWLNEQGYDLTRGDLIQYRAYLGATYKPATAKRMWSVAHRIIKEQVDMGHLEKDPLANVHGFSVSGEGSPHIALTKEEANRLLQSIDTASGKGKRDYAIIQILLRTGLRRFELAALNAESLVSNQGHMTLQLPETKGDKQDIVKLPVDVWRALSVYMYSINLRSGPLFISFTSGGKPKWIRLSGNDIYRILKKYATLAGINKLTPHGLRASFITLAIEGGASLEQTQYAARHADPRMTERYRRRKLNLDNNAVDYIHLDG